MSDNTKLYLARALTIVNAVVLLAYLGALVAVHVRAADVTVPFTAGQNTYVRNVAIPIANEARCRQWPGVPARTPVFPCTTANVTAAGCVAAPFSAVTKKNLVFRSCTIYTQDAAGEAAFAADQLYQIKVEDAVAERDTDHTLSRAAWFAATQLQRDNACAAIGRPADCILVR